MNGGSVGNHGSNAAFTINGNATLNASQLGMNQGGTETTVKNITLADIQDYYNKDITSKGAKVVIVGDLVVAGAKWGRVRATVANARIRSRTCRRLKIDPT